MIDKTEVALLDLRYILEALRSAKVELEAVEDTFGDYTPSGHLFDQLEEAIELVEGWV